jgi:phosphoesterase RecJ-like protein
LTTWTANASLEDIAARLRAARKVIVLTHVKPDGDAIGSTAALVRSLNKPTAWSRGARAEAWYMGPTPPWLADVISDTPHKLLADHGPPDVEGVDAVAVLDTGSWSQLEAVHQWLGPRREMTVLVDHHVQGDAEVAAHRHIDTSAAAVCQPVAELCRLILNAPDRTKLPADVAEPLYLGLCTDTGWFRHSNVSRPVMLCAGDLLDAGANHVRLYQTLEQRESVSRLKLLSRALATLELHDNNRLAIMSLTKKDMAESGAQPGESGGFVDFGQSIASVEVTCILTEATASDYGQGNPHADPKGPLTKISLRSKASGHEVDVNRIAKQLGGGGHVRAAGARTSQSIEDTKAAIIRLVQEQTRG